MTEDEFTALVKEYCLKGKLLGLRVDDKHSGMLPGMHMSKEGVAVMSISSARCRLRFGDHIDYWYLDRHEVMFKKFLDILNEGILYYDPT